MPRTYSFDHFTGPKQLSPSRAMRRKDKQAVAQHEQGGSEGGIHYGKNHAETEALIQARAMEKQLLALAGPTLAEQELRRSQAVPQVGTEGVFISAPVGALPPAEPLPESGAWRGLEKETLQRWRALRKGVKDTQKAVRSLFTLPFEAFKRLGPWSSPLKN